MCSFANKLLASYAAAGNDLLMHAPLNVSISTAPTSTLSSVKWPGMIHSKASITNVDASVTDVNHVMIIRPAFLSIPTDSLSTTSLANAAAYLTTVQSSCNAPFVGSLESAAHNCAVDDSDKEMSKSHPLS